LQLKLKDQYILIGGLMSQHHELKGQYDLEYLGLRNVNTIYWNLTTPWLYEQVVRRREGLISHLGPLVVRTGSYTGRSPNDKFIVKEKKNEDKIWWGKVNCPFEEKQFDSIWARMQAYLQGGDMFVQDCYIGTDNKYQIPVRVITEYAWHSLFIRNMFVRITDDDELAAHKPEFTIIDLPKFHAVPELDKTNSEAFILINFDKKLVLIG
jgi:phosphoenolpyruvate carboxykinase (ATP)